jgi:hypothetical protein
LPPRRDKRDGKGRAWRRENFEREREKSWSVFVFSFFLAVFSRETVYPPLLSTLFSLFVSTIERRREREKTRERVECFVSDNSPLCYFK